MPTIKSAKKRLRQSRKRAERKRGQRSRLNTAIKRVMEADDADTATELFRETSALLDRMGSRGVIHPNKANRKKAQLARHVKEVGGQP